MFLGEYNHSVDSKGRISLPIKFRDQLSQPFYITRGMEDCLFIYDQEEWMRMDEKIRKLRLTAKAARGFSRMFYAGAMEVSLDKQGRFVIPPHLRSYAGIESDAVIVGVSDRIEVWDKQAWNSYMDSDAMDYDELTESLNASDTDL